MSYPNCSLEKYVSEIKGGQIVVAPQDLLCVID